LISHVLDIKLILKNVNSGLFENTSVPYAYDSTDTFHSSDQVVIKKSIK